jgi:hypothetical protein
MTACLHQTVYGFMIYMPFEMTSVIYTNYPMLLVEHEMKNQIPRIIFSGIYAFNIKIIFKCDRNN